MPCYEEAGLLWVHGVHGKVGENQEVVRCRECKYYTEYDFCKSDQWTGCYGDMPIVNADDYCSYGRRKEGAEE